jgi:hypothetical protein
MNRSAPTAAAAATTSASVASGLPNRMLSATLPSNMKFSCVTITT